MKMSPSIANLAKALVAAQAEMHAIGKDAANPFFKSSYTSLAALIDGLREPFKKHGLAFLQPTSPGPEGSLIVETMLVHTSGEWIMGELPGKPVKDDPQGRGSLMSYLKRYGLQGMAGVASKDDDDDGNAASGKNQGDQRPRGRPPGSKNEPRALPGHLAEHMPFGGEEIYGAMPHQKILLQRDAKALGITDTVSLQHISAMCVDQGVWVQHLPNAIKEWLADRKGTENATAHKN